MKRFIDRLPKGPVLPEAVERELTAPLFAMTVPVGGSTLLLGVVGGLLVLRWHDALLAALICATLLVNAARLALVASVSPNAWADLPILELRLWERRYGAGACIAALLLGLFAARVIQHRTPMADLVAVSMVFTVGAGLVARIASRLVLCVSSLLLLTIPTIIALAMVAASQQNNALHFQLLAIESVIVAVVTLLSIQTAHHIHGVAVESLLIRHELVQLVRTDDLTGLANRMFLREWHRREFRAIDDSSDDVAVLYLDLDGFKTINDHYGHLTGDAVLRQVATRLTSLIRVSDTVARIGGDEFVIVQNGIHSPAEAEVLAQRIIDNLSLAYNVDGITVKLSVSVGIAMGHQHGGDWEDLLARADTALYAAKAAGKGRIAFHDANSPIRARKLDI